MKKNILSKLIVSLSGLALMVALVPSAQAIGISPTRFEYSLDPGDTRSGTIGVGNRSDEDVNVEIEVFLIEGNDEAGFPILDYDSGDNQVEDAADWFTIPSELITVPADGSADVDFSFVVPENATVGGKYVSVAVKPVVERTEEDQIVISTRAAAMVFIDVIGDSVIAGDVVSYGIPEGLKGDEDFTLDVRMENTGNTHFKPQGEIKIVDRDTGEQAMGIAQYREGDDGPLTVSDVLRLNPNDGNILPGSTRTFRTVWRRNVRTGNFTATLTAQAIGQEEPITQSLDFEIEESLSVDEFVLNADESSASFTLTVTNNGEMEEKLEGAIEVTNTFGYKVAEVAVPEDAPYILPGETKTFTFEWLNKEIPQGRYTAESEITYGFADSELEAEITFGELDRSKLYLMIALVIAILIALKATFGKRKK